MTLGDRLAALDQRWRDAAQRSADYFTIIELRDRCADLARRVRWWRFNAIVTSIGLWVLCAAIWLKPVLFK